MWSALAEGFSEFASVVSKDAKTIYTKTSTVLQEKEDEDDAAAYEADKSYQDESPSSSPTSSFLTRISQDEFSKDIPTNPASSVSEGDKTDNIVAEENWISQVRALQQNLKETFFTDLDDEDANLFTPNWLRVDVSSINEEGMPNDTTERQLFSTGQLLLQNSETFRDSFVTIFPEAKEGHSLETLQNAILEENEAIADSDSNPEAEKNNQRLLPSRFLVRYFVRLNKLFFHQVRGSDGFERKRQQPQQQQNANSNNEQASSNLNKNLVARNQQLEQENEHLQNRLRDQEQQIQDQTALMTEYKVRWSDSVQEVDRLKKENSEQEKITRQLRLEVERLKFSIASSENNSKTNNNDSSSAVDLVQSQQEGSSSSSTTKNSNEKNSGVAGAVSVSTKKRDQDDEDDEEGWTDIA